MLNKVYALEFYGIMNRCNACANCAEKKPCLQPPFITADRVMSSNLCDIHLRNAPLAGVDKIKGPTVNLSCYTMKELYQKIQDILSCHEHLKEKGLIGCNVDPVLHLDIYYNEC